MLDRMQTLDVKPQVIDPEIALIQAALDRYRAGGKTVSHEEVMQKMYAIIEQARVKQAK